MTTRQTLLSMLKAHSGEWVSGELLCRKLNISRTAVSKHMTVLKSNGYNILSSTRKGYNLAGIKDLFIKEEITDKLKTKVFGQSQILILDKTDSTNIQARKLAEQGASHGSLVIAEDQTHGRGRKDRHWFSHPGKAIMMSMILRPKLPPEKAPCLTLLTAVAVAKTLTKLTDLQVAIKWPNDILVDSKKLAGISTGLSTDMDRVNYVIIGLGLNVNTLKNDFPKELHDIATSILVETAPPLSRVKIIKYFLFEFESCYNKMKTEGFSPILSQWKKFANIIGKEITIDMTDRTLSGTVLDIDPDGVLIVRDKNNTDHRILSGDISLLDG